MELWGGIECSINRTGDEYHDQLDLSGHYSRPDDAERFASLGIKAIRYPILWERHQPSPSKAIDWSLTAKNLSVFKRLEVEVIAGLVHHGSGPDFVNILEESFVSGLTSYARNVARKFPWINYYTPVNEPLTTARFCGLYGLWFPHGKSDSCFLRILINECRATILAMKAIREINPQAKLVQTEDIGKVHSTTALSYQSDFENIRRWLSFDLLNGKMDSSHELYGYLLTNGITEHELDEIRGNFFPPDILGANYYVTSERYLDESVADYPEIAHGGNGRDRYADVEAVRTSAVETDGPEKIFEQVWMRYHLPIAITEVHLHSGREDQLRWLKYVWDAAVQLNEKGVKVVAVTVWSLLGAYGWNSLLTGNFDHYEAGAFDVQSGTPRETAIARMIRQLASGNNKFHPVLQGKGWWEMPARILYGAAVLSKNISNGVSCVPVMVLGTDTALGKRFLEMCNQRNLAVIGINSWECQPANSDLSTALLEKYTPWAVVNAMGYMDIDYAEQDALRCYQNNTLHVKHLATACRSKGVQLLTFSTDMVFDGTKSHAYHELDKANPLNLFGKTKLQAEYFALDIHPQTLVVRSGAIFDNLGHLKVLEGLMPSLREGRDVFVPHDVFFSATYMPELVAVCLDLLVDGASGLWHLSNQGSLNWYELATMLIPIKGTDPDNIIPIHISEIPGAAPRPLSCIMGSNHGLLMSSLESVVGFFSSNPA